MVTSKENASRRDLGLGVIEEAWFLLRCARLQTWLVYQLGAVPFVAAVFFFWADMSRSSFAAIDALWASLTVVLAYFWMKSMQAWFCRRLWAQIHSDGELPDLRGWRLIRSFVVHGLLQSLALPALIVALVFVVPLAWVFSFFHNVTVLGLTRDPGDQPLRNLVSQASRLAHWRWAANHVTLGVIMLTAMLLWANVVTLAITAPQFLRWLSGVESVFTLFPLASLANTTFLFATILVTWLFVGPLVKAIFVIRCFYGGSRKNGWDLLGRLESIRSVRRLNAAAANRLAVTAAAVALGLAGIGSADAQESSASSESDKRTPDKVSAFDRALGETLKTKPYQWRLSREFRGMDGERTGDKPEGFAATVQRAFERMGERLKQFVAAIFQRGGGTAGGLGGGASEPAGPLSTVLAVISLLLVAGLLAWALAKARQRLKSAMRADGAMRPASLNPDEVDLENDDLMASELPELEWLLLARKQIAEGEFRLAVRALFLGTLANLGERGLISIARHKSNRDYVEEVKRRSKTRSEEVGLFGEGVREFDRFWYGKHKVASDEAVGFAELCRSLIGGKDAPQVWSSIIGREGEHV